MIKCTTLYVRRELGLILIKQCISRSRESASDADMCHTQDTPRDTKPKQKLIRYFTKETNSITECLKLTNIPNDKSV